MNLHAEPTTGAPETLRSNRREERFLDVFLRYRKPIHKFFAGHGLPPEECKDLTQDTFLRVFKGIDGVRSEEALKAWVFKVATHVFYNRLREQSAQKRDAEEVCLEVTTGSDEGVGSIPLRSPGRSPLSELLIAEELRQLRTALDHLPERMRRCVLLRVDEDLRYREIAEELGISIETVKAHLHQAKHLLKAMLGDYFAVPDFEEEDAGGS